jgi:hypothetical protein
LPPQNKIFGGNSKFTMIASARLLFRTSRVAAARSTKLLACRYADILDPYHLTSYEKRLFHRDEKRRSALDGEAEDASRGIPEHKEESNIPQRIRQKVISAQDAVSLVRSGDTVVVSGFVCQGKERFIWLCSHCGHSPSFISLTYPYLLLAL